MTFNPHPKVFKEKKKPQGLKKKFPKETGELNLFKKIFQDRGRRCQITGNQIFEFDVNCFLHILSKGTRADLRLNPDNVLLVIPEIHHLYDNSSKEKLLQKYPKAAFIYTVKEQLKSIPIIKK